MRGLDQSRNKGTQNWPSKGHSDLGGSQGELNLALSHRNHLELKIIKGELWPVEGREIS